jgi:glycosyltransferase involved in cell wall biosynthesis
VSPPRRIHVHAVVDTMGAGGAELLLAEQAALAPALGIDLTVAYLAELPTGSPARDKLREHGVEPVYVPVTSISRRAIRDVRANVRATAPDLVHTHLGASDLLGVVAARTLGVPAVSTVHAMVWDHGPPMNRVRERLTTTACALLARKVVMVSDFARAKYLAEHRDRPSHVVTIRNGVRGVPEPGAGVRVRAELGIPADAPLVMMLAALRREKAHDVAIEAIREVRRTRPDVRFVVVGAGALESRVREAMEVLGDAGIMAGYRADVMALLDAADVLVQPSLADALPTSLIEAAAASVPVVATRIGGIPEIVADGETGVLVDAPPRAELVADALGHLLDDPGRRTAMGAAARRRFETEFQAQVWMGRLRALYDDVLAG